MENLKIDYGYLNHKYVNDIKVRMSHHNTALEGNTLTLSETISIILHQTYVNMEQNKNIDLREIYEVVNSGEAFDFI